AAVPVVHRNAAGFRHAAGGCLPACAHVKSECRQLFLVVHRGLSGIDVGLTHTGGVVVLDGCEIALQLPCNAAAGGLKSLETGIFRRIIQAADAVYTGCCA
ncbi:MAG: hypothetical protein ACLUDF_03550, partial [Butyricicoccus sp.]